ncbi:MAG: hypothetical protein HDQ88_06460 [Clostridia bacterium]|nr:hypothetical protein [Clostridia bacterium]
MVPKLNAQLKINADPARIEETSKHIRQAIEYLRFLDQTVNTGRATQHDVDTSVSLLLSEIDGMKTDLELDEIQSKVQQWQNRAMADMAVETQLLRQDVGKGINAIQLSAALSTARERFENWYEWVGFHYAFVELGEHGIVARLTHDVYEYDEYDDPPTETKFGPNSEYGFDLIKQPYKCQLKDCDQNRTELRRMLKHYFPNVQFRKFESRRSDDPNEFGLETTVFVEYADLENISYA